MNIMYYNAVFGTNMNTVFEVIKFYNLIQSFKIHIM